MKLLVHLHIFHQEQVDYYIGKMSCISGCQWDLYVTYSGGKPEWIQKILSFRPDAVLVCVPNVGYDIWPFIKVVRDTADEGYDFILKLHTKSARNYNVRINGVCYYGNEWRDELVDALLKSPEHFRKILDEMAADDRLGMACSDLLYMKTDVAGHTEDYTLLDNELERLGIEGGERMFCAGTIFLVRASAMKFLCSGKINEQMFEGRLLTGSAGSMAHVYERILTIAVTAQGFSVMNVVTRPLRSLAVRMNRGLKNVFSIERSGEQRKKYLTVAGMRFCVGGPKDVE